MEQYWVSSSAGASTAWGCDIEGIVPYTGDYTKTSACEAALPQYAATIGSKWAHSLIAIRSSA